MGYKILIADDEQEIRDVLRLYLEKDGYEVTEAQDGLEAMKLLGEQEYDLLLLDIMVWTVTVCSAISGRRTMFR